MSHSGKSRGGATPSQKRPRVEGPAKEMQISNSTMSQFLGGKPRAWMTGASFEGKCQNQYQITENPTSTLLTARSVPTPISPGFVNQSIPHPTAPAYPQPQQEHLDHTGPPYLGSVEQATTMADPSLPSPSPSDDALQTDDTITILPMGMQQQRVRHTTQQQNNDQAAQNHTASLSPNNARFASLLEKYGSIDELERDLEAAARNKRPPEATLLNASRSTIHTGNEEQNGVTLTHTQSSNPPASNPNGTVPMSRTIVPSMPAPSIDLLASGLQFHLPAVQWRIRSVQAPPASVAINHLEESRLVLIQKACEAGDVFYLALHQIYCLYSLPAFHVDRYLDKEHIDGLRKLAELILENSEMGLNSVQWLSEFPWPFDMLLKRSSIYSAAYTDVKRCLKLLGKGLDPLRNLCLTRKEPPLIDLMEAELAIKSTVLQEIVYVSIHRALWVGKQDTCFTNSAALFNNNQAMSQEWHLRRIHGNPPSNDEMTSYYQRLVAQYQYLQRFHLQHTQQQASRHNGVEPRNVAMVLPTEQESHIVGGHPSVNSLRDSSRPSTVCPNQSTGVSMGNAVMNSLARTNYPMPRSTSTTSRSQSNVTQQSICDRPRPTLVLPSSRGSSSGLATSVQSPVTISPVQNQPNLPSGYSHQPLASHRLMNQPVPSFYAQNPDPRLVPQPGSTLPYAALTNQITPMLHQAHLRDPELVVEPSGAESDAGTSYYQYFKEMAGEPSLIMPQSRNVYCRFSMSSSRLKHVSRDEPQPHGAPSRRTVRNGSYTIRLRCIKLPLSDEALINQWPLEETLWPNNCAIQFNDAPLELRRKALHGKDLPVDLTNIVRGGSNEVHAAILRVGAVVETGPVYVLAVEIIELGDLTTVKEQARLIDETGVQERISKIVTATDGDIEVLSSNLTVDITDPFSSSLITTPVRARACLHAECFDLDNFLETRHGSVKGTPCNPEQFRCPICRSDARPQCLVIDQWFVKVLEEIRRMDRLDARCIIIDGTGSWKIKEEEVGGETGDGTGQRRRASGTAAAARVLSKPPESEIIEID